MEHKNRKEKEEERERWRIDGEEGRREGGCFLGVGGRTLNQEEVKGIILKDKKKMHCSFSRLARLRPGPIRSPSLNCRTQFKLFRCVASL